MKIVGHRGASNIAPENTAIAVKKAFELGADAVEIDIHVTKDNKLVVIHDDNLKRTGGVDINVEDSNFNDIRDYEVGGWFNESFRGEPLPLLSDILAIVPKGKILIIEVKKSLEPKLLLDELKKVSDDMSNYIIISFSLNVLQQIKVLESSLTVLWIPPEYSDKVKKLPTTDELKQLMSEVMVDGLAFDSRLSVSSDDIDNVRKLGLKILYTWTVDDLDKAELLYRLKVDGIESNNLNLIMKGSYRKI